GLSGTADIEDQPLVAVVCAEPDRVSLDVNGVRMDFAVHRVGDVSYVDSPEGLVTLTELARFPLPVPAPAEGRLMSPVPGTVSRILVVPGQRVDAGDLLMVLEAMTLEHPVYAPGAGLPAEVPVTTAGPAALSPLCGRISVVRSAGGGSVSVARSTGRGWVGIDHASGWLTGSGVTRTASSAGTAAGNAARSSRSSSALGRAAGSLAMP